MKTHEDYFALTPKVITSVRTLLGYMQVLEYILQDCSYLHVVQWHFDNDLEQDLEKDTLIPRLHNEIFYRSKDAALDFAHGVGNNLLQQVLI